MQTSAVTLVRKFCGSCNANAAAAMYQLLGGELSPYTAKVRSYLRHKKIPFETVQASAEVVTKFVKPKVGWRVFPVLVAGDENVIQDSTEIVSYLENIHPEPTILPQTPKQKVVSLLLEMFSDEWMVQPIMHYRWSYPENLPFLREEFGRVAFPKESTKARCEIADMMYGHFKGMLPNLGITETTGPAIEDSWNSLLVDLTAHFDKYPYFLGGQPCIADFALGGMIYAHLYRDPVSGFQMKTRAPLVAAWTEHMNGHMEHPRHCLHEIDSKGWIRKEILPQAERQFLASDEIPQTLEPILKRFFKEFAPVLLSTKQHLTAYIESKVGPANTKLPRSLGTHNYEIGNVTGSRGIFPFNMWMWQRVVDLYRSLSAAEQQEVDRYVSQFPYGRDIVAADLSKCRVERISNILHAALEPKSKL